MTKEEIQQQVETLSSITNRNMNSADLTMVFTGVFELIVSQQIQIAELRSKVNSQGEALKVLTSGGKLPTEMGKPSSGFSIG